MGSLVHSDEAATRQEYVDFVKRFLRGFGVSKEESATLTDYFKDYVGEEFEKGTAPWYVAASVLDMMLREI